METYKEWEDYFIDGTDVLKNKLGITEKEELKEKETEITLRKLVELYERPIEGNFDKEHYCNLHKYLFGDIYDFASALAPKKLLIESGTKDKLFPISGSEYAHSNIARIYKLMNAENNLVIDVFNGKHCVNGNLSFDWLSE